MGDIIITVGRQYGSGGREIGKELAHQLGIACYDSTLLERTARTSGLTSGIVERYDEKLKDRWLHMSAGGWFGDPNYIPVPLRAAISQFNIISDIGRKESAVIIGRCADYVLRDQENVLSVFIYADIDKRIECVAARNNVSEAEARKLVRKTDKQRASYYKYYTGKKWGVPDSYHLCIDSGLFGIEGAIMMLKKSAHLFHTENSFR